MLAPALVAGAGLAGCASKGDVQMVQGEVALLKAETARRDSARAAQLAEVIQLQQPIMDSLTATRRAVAQLKGDLSTDLYNIQQQLVQLQELTGQSQQRLTELRTRLEARGAQIETGPPATPGDSARARSGAARAPRPTRCTRPRWRSSGAAVSPPRGSGSGRCSGSIPPASGRRTRCTSSGRASPRRTPTRRPPTTGRWWRSTPALRARPSALYNLGLLAERRKDNAGAREAYQRVAQKYPQSDEAALARDRLKALGR